MKNQTFNGMRLFRFAWWVLATLAAFVFTQIYFPHWTLYVPCFALLFFVPAVLLPLRPKRKG